MKIGDKIILLGTKDEEGFIEAWYIDEIFPEGNHIVIYRPSDEHKYSKVMVIRTIDLEELEGKLFYWVN